MAVGPLAGLASPPGRGKGPGVRVVFGALALLLVAGGCSRSASPDEAGPRAFEREVAGVRVTAAPGAVPDGTETTIARTEAPNPLAPLRAGSITALAPGVDIELDGGATQPGEPLRVAIDVDSSVVAPDGVVGVVLQSRGAEPEFVRGEWDAASSEVVADVPHLSSIWPVQLDVDKIVRDASTYVMESTGIQSARPPCTDDEPSIDGRTYSVVQPAQAWVCLSEDAGGLQVDVSANSPVPFQITSRPSASSSVPITDLGDGSVFGAAIARALSPRSSGGGLVGGGVGTRFGFDPAAPSTMTFRSDPPLLLVQIVISALQPVLNARKIETLGKAKCFRDIVGTAGRPRLDASTAAALTTAVLSCVGEVVELSPPGAVFLALVSSVPQAFAGTFIGLVSEFTGLGTFRVQVEATDEAPASRVPTGFVGEWFVHGGDLVVRPDGTARASGHSTCPEGWGSTWCDDVMEMSVAMEGDTLRLDVVRVFVQDENGRRGSPAYPPSASTGSYYLMELLPDGAASTELHNDDGVVTGANGLGNPFLCRSDSVAAQEGTCGA